MKRFILSALLTVSAGLALVSCDNGPYDSNPDTNYTNSVNPLNPTGGIDNSFGWSGEDPMSMELNGVAWKADDAMMFESFDQKHWFISGQKYAGDTSNLTLYLPKDVKVGNSYFVHLGNTESSASYTFNIGDPNTEYASGAANLGEIKILEHTATHMKGLFFFLAKNPETNIYINIQKGYFNVMKP